MRYADWAGGKVLAVLLSPSSSANGVARPIAAHPPILATAFPLLGGKSPHKRKIVWAHLSFRQGLTLVAFRAQGVSHGETGIDTGYAGQF